MQSSYRNFLAASIGAAVLIGSAEASLAEAISGSSLEFVKPSKVGETESDRPLLSVESLSLSDLDIENNSDRQSADAHQLSTTLLAESTAQNEPAEAIVSYSTELFQTAEIVAAVERAKAAQSGESELDESSDENRLDNEGVEGAIASEAPELSQEAELSNEAEPDPEFNPAAERSDFELLVQVEPDLAPTESDARVESDVTDVEDIDAEIETDVLEPEEVEIEVESEPDAETEVDLEVEEEGNLDSVPVLEDIPTSDSTDVEDIDAEIETDVLEPEEVEVEVEIEVESEPDAEAEVDLEVEEEGNLDSVPVLEDIPTSDSAIDLEIPTETIPIIPAPDYLDADPNPLTFPTDPDEIDVVGNQPITLAQALELARRNSRELRNARLNYDRAAAALDEALAQRLPRLTTGADLVHTDLNPAQNTVEQIDPQTGQTVDVPIDRDNNTTTFSADVQLTYDLFTSGQRAASIQASRSNLRQQELQVEVVLEDIRLNVTNAYYDVQETDESVRIAQSSLEESLESLRIAEARERAGVGTRFDRLQAEVDAANSQQELRRAISNQLIARRQLAQVLSIPTGVTISAADEVEVAGSWLLSLEESLVLAFKNRAEPEQLLVQREIDQQQRRAELGALGPQLSAFGRYRLQDELDETRGSSDNEALEVGLQLDLLLFDGGAARARARQEAIDIEIAESDFADTLEDIRFDVEQSFFQLGSNFENIQTAATAVEVAQESLRLARLRFSAGVGIQSDVITAQADLTQAEFNLVSAILDYNRALVSMQRAVSNLDGNNLSDVP